MSRLKEKAGFPLGPVNGRASPERAVPSMGAGAVFSAVPRTFRVQTHTPPTSHSPSGSPGSCGRSLCFWRQSECHSPSRCSLSLSLPRVHRWSKARSCPGPLRGPVSLPERLARC